MSSTYADPVNALLLHCEDLENNAGDHHALLQWAGLVKDKVVCAHNFDLFTRRKSAITACSPTCQGIQRLVH
jgi:hypothetical protein